LLSGRPAPAARGYFQKDKPQGAENHPLRCLRFIAQNLQIQPGEERNFPLAGGLQNFAPRGGKILQILRMAARLLPVTALRHAGDVP